MCKQGCSSPSLPQTQQQKNTLSPVFFLFSFLLRAQWPLVLLMHTESFKLDDEDTRHSTAQYLPPMHSGGFCHLVSACSNLYIFYFFDDLILTPRYKKENKMHQQKLVSVFVYSFSVVPKLCISLLSVLAVRVHMCACLCTCCGLCKCGLSLSLCSSLSGW